MLPREKRRGKGPFFREEKNRAHLFKYGEKKRRKGGKP